MIRHLLSCRKLGIVQTERGAELAKKIPQLFYPLSVQRMNETDQNLALYHGQRTPSLRHHGWSKHKRHSWNLELRRSKTLGLWGRGWREKGCPSPSILQTNEYLKGRINYFFTAMVKGLYNNFRWCFEVQPPTPLYCVGYLAHAPCSCELESTRFSLSGGLTTVNI